jgi:hypothetical protein
MAPSRNRGKGKAKKTTPEKKSSAVAAKEGKKEQTKSMKTASAEKAAQEKRKRSPSSSTQKKKQKHSKVSPVELKVTEDDDDSSLSRDSTSTTDEEDLIEPSKKPRAKKDVNEETASLASPSELREALADTAERLERAEKQVRAISKTRIADSFQEGQVRSWTKETLWKQVKFITNDITMNKIMKKATKHFNVPTEEQEHWMSTYTHIVRDGLNQKQNACSQDLRKTIKSKCHAFLQQDTNKIRIRDWC